MLMPLTPYDYEFWRITPEIFNQRLIELETMLAQSASWRSSPEETLIGLGTIISHLRHHPAACIPKDQSASGTTIRLDRKWLETGIVPKQAHLVLFERIDFETITG